jgi:hypothetical protein
MGRGHDQTSLNYMKTNIAIRNIKIDWLIPLLGIALVVGGLLAAVSYLDMERKVHSAEALAATLDNLYQDQKLSAVLKTIHEGDVAVAAQQLDLLLCDNILRLNSELASADDRTRTYVEDAFRRMARLRPRIPEAAPSKVVPEPTEDQVAAQRILALAMVSDVPAR